MCVCECMRVCGITKPIRILRLASYLSPLSLSHPLTPLSPHHLIYHYTHTNTHRDSTFNIGTLRVASTKFANEANRMRRLVPTKFIELILMHLSIILDLSGVLFDELKTSLKNNDVGKTSSSASSSTRGKHSRTKNSDKG